MKSIFTLLVCLLLAACAGQPRNTLSTEERVTERAEARWELLIDKRYARAYEYLSPASREIQSLEFYIMRTGRSVLNWKEASVQSVLCEQPDVCLVEVYVEALASPPVPRGRPVPTNRTLTETWVRANGNWYFVPSELQ